MKQKLAKSQRKSIYDYDQRINRTFNLIENDLSQKNNQIIKKYDRLMISQGQSKASRLKHIQTILNLCRMLEKDWDFATKDDIEKVVVKIQETYSDERGLETHSSHDHKKILKIFYRWFKLGSRDFKEVGDPPETKYVKVKRVPDKIIREDLITEDDFEKILQACGGNTRDRALISCHYEGGTRPSEILGLKIKNVKFDKYGSVLFVDGKTGARPVRLVTSTPNLANWYNVHPFKNNPEAPLWIDLGNKNYGSTLTYHAASAMVRRRCEKANLSKRVYLNLFRHSEATRSATYMTEAQMRKRHGWTPYSKMAGRYVHLVNADVDKAVLEHYGIQKPKSKDAKFPQICPVCKNANSFDATVCSQCGKPLDLQTALEREEKGTKEKEAQNKKIKELAEDLKEIHKELEKERFVKKWMTKILYKNRDKIPGLAISVRNPQKDILSVRQEKNLAKKYFSRSKKPQNHIKT